MFCHFLKKKARRPYTYLIRFSGHDFVEWRSTLFDELFADHYTITENFTLAGIGNALLENLVGIIDAEHAG